MKQESFCNEVNSSTKANATKQFQTLDLLVMGVQEMETLFFACMLHSAQVK